MVELISPIGSMKSVAGKRPIVVLAAALGLPGCATPMTQIDGLASSLNSYSTVPVIEASSEKPVMLPNSISRCPTVQATYHRDDDGRNVLLNFVGGPKLGDCFRQNLKTGELTETIVTVFRKLDGPSLSQTQDDETLQAWNAILNAKVSEINYKAKEVKFIQVPDNMYYNYTFNNTLRLLPDSNYDLNGEKLKTRDIIYISRRPDGSEVNERKYKFAMLPDGSFLIADISRTENSTDKEYPMNGWPTMHLIDLRCVHSPSQFPSQPP